jgi:hypothetical protein
MSLLPDVPGMVHGIVSLDPPIIQCDGCGRTHTERTIELAILLSGIQFSPAHPGRRLCLECRIAEGWDIR